MAARQTKKPAAKRPAAKRSAPKAEPKAAIKSETVLEQANGKRQLWAVLLFAVTVLLFFVILINGKGENGEVNAWSVMHDFFLGLFGICAVLWPLLLGYTAIMLAMDKPVGKINTKIWEICIFIIFLDSAINIFTKQLNWGELWKSGMQFKSGGVGGFPVAWVLNKFGTPGAHIIICLLIFVLAMVVTGTKLLQLFSIIGKPIKNTYEKAEGNYSKEASEPRFDIDIKIDDHPVKNPVDDSEAEEISAKFAEEELREKRKKLAEAFELTIPESNTEPIKPIEKDTIKQVTMDEFVPPREKEKSSGRKKPYPPMSLLDEAPTGSDENQIEEQNQTARKLVDTLDSFNVAVKVVGVSRGPSVTRYEIQPNVGVRINKITALSDDLALALRAKGVRIEAPIPGKAAVGIEIPNKTVSPVKIREVLESKAFQTSKSNLTVALGKDIEGNVAVTDLSKMPHLLVAGTTGSGKSVSINSMIISLLYKATKEDVRLILIDPKKVEFTKYDGIPHLLVPVVTDPRKSAGALAWAVQEMLKRYNLFAENKVRDLESYNNLAAKETGEELEPLPRIIIFIDEFADLMMECPSEVEESVIRLAQMARAAGMHLVIATQRPAADVITGLIRSNIPSRLALAVKYESESRIILGSQGAEKLLGYGDMLFEPISSKTALRIQGCYVSDREIEAVVNYLSNSEVTYDEDVMEEIERQSIAEKGGKSRGGEGEDNSKMDDTLISAIDWVMEAGQASVSMLQRRLSVGHSRAGRLIDEMENRGIVGPSEGSKPRQLLMTRQQWLELKQNL